MKTIQIANYRHCKTDRMFWFQVSVTKVFKKNSFSVRTPPFLKKNKWIFFIYQKVIYLFMTYSGFFKNKNNPYDTIRYTSQSLVKLNLFCPERASEYSLFIQWSMRCFKQKLQVLFLFSNIFIIEYQLEFQIMSNYGLMM